METTIGACGLVCSKCSARAATLAGDRKAIEAVAEQWRKIHSPSITASDVWCTGCMSAGGPKCGHAGACSTRKCVISKGYSTCADCGDYPCGDMAKFIEAVPHVKDVIDALRKATAAQ
jgi:hypothetical protein